MKLLRVMVALFVVAMVAGASAQMINDYYMVPKTTVVPVIDGVLDPVWHNVFEQPQRTNMINGTSDDHLDLWGFSRVMWDEQNMYLFLRTQDDVFYNANANVWENDSWEVYFDGDNSKGAAYDGVNDMQVRFHAGSTVTETTGATLPDMTGVEFASIVPEDGTGNTIFEIKFPMANIFVDPTAGTEFGFELQQNDADGGATARESETKWWNMENDLSWNQPQVLGTAMLWDREVGEVMDVYQISAPPVIDGVQDDVWKGLPAFSMNSFDNGTEVPYSDEDWYGNFQVAWDANNFYFFSNTMDEINYNANPNVWENDCFEVYFDPDNSKAVGAYDGVNDQQIRFGSNDVVAADLDGGSFWVRDGVEFVNKLADDGTGAYTLEAKMPMAGLLLDPTVGTEFGFEVQGGDADGGVTARESVTKWWVEVGDPSWNDPSTFGTAVLVTDQVAVSERSGVAKSFALSQNYPNPFNPTTSIDFSVTRQGAVKLAVYDLTGKQVANLVNEVKPAGNYSASFDASSLPSGVYFYKLEADSKVSTKKMMLLK